MEEALTMLGMLQLLVGVGTLIVGASEHQQHNMNLQKGYLTTVCRLRSLMIKSTNDGEEEADNSHSWDPLPRGRSSRYIGRGLSIFS